MRAAYDAGDATAALDEQHWKQDSAEPIFSKYGGTPAKRAAYRKFIGVEMGCSRLGDCFDEANYDSLVSELDAIGFWDQAPP